MMSTFAHEDEATVTHWTDADPLLLPASYLPSFPRPSSSSSSFKGQLVHFISQGRRLLFENFIFKDNFIQIHYKRS